MTMQRKEHPEIDRQSVNRIVKENADFKDFIDLVSNYYQTGRVNFCKLLGNKLNKKSINLYNNSYITQWIAYLTCASQSIYHHL